MKVRGKLNPMLDRANPRVKTLSQSFRFDDNEARALLRELDTAFRKLERRLFKTEGVSGGRGWKPLSDRYARWKTRMLKGTLRELRRENRQVSRLRGKRARTPSLGSVDKILQLSGQMKDSFINKSDPEHIAQYRLRPSVAFTMGSSNPIAPYHGSRDSRRVIPFRDPIKMTTRQRTQLINLARRRYVAKIRRIEKAMRKLMQVTPAR